MGVDVAFCAYASQHGHRGSGGVRPIDLEYYPGFDCQQKYDSKTVGRSPLFNIPVSRHCK